MRVFALALALALTLTLTLAYKELSMPQSTQFPPIPLQKSMDAVRIDDPGKFTRCSTLCYLNLLRLCSGYFHFVVLGVHFVLSDVLCRMCLQVVQQRRTFEAPHMVCCNLVTVVSDAAFGARNEHDSTVTFNRIVKVRPLFTPVKPKARTDEVAQ